MRAHNANAIANAIALRANARLGRAHGARFVAQQANTRIASLAKARIPSGARMFRSKCMRASLAKARQPSECAHRWRMSARAPRANGPLARYIKLRVRMRRECRERFPRHRR